MILSIKDHFFGLIEYAFTPIFYLEKGHLYYMKQNKVGFS